MKKRASWPALLIWIVVFQGMGALMGWLSRPGSDAWYFALLRSPWTPPSWVFGVIWPLLYVMLACSAWRLWSDRGHKKAQKAFALQMITNWLWSPCFFIMHQTTLSAIMIATILVATAFVIKNTWHADPLQRFLLLPYVLWSSFAFYLNVWIVMNNP